MSVNPEHPKIPYWHLWTDDEGITHQTRCDLTSFEWQSMGGKAGAQWNDHLLSGENSLLFAILPVGWNGDWHENPKPQWISVLSGRWFVESTDGTKRGDGSRRSRLRRRSEREARRGWPGRASLGHGRR